MNAAMVTGAICAAIGIIAWAIVTKIMEKKK